LRQGLGDILKVEFLCASETFKDVLFDNLVRMWLYSDATILDLTKTEKKACSRDRYWLEIAPQTCLYCSGRLTRIAEVGPQTDVMACPYCGWWAVTHLEYYEDSELDYERNFWRYAGVLREFDIGDQSVPLMQLQGCLTANYDLRYRVQPRRFEEVVAGVFSDFGFRVHLIGASSGDDGIDLIVLQGADDKEIGVQIKRYRGKVEAEQIREFAGALLLKGMTNGIFVTTSSFTRGARSTAGRYKARGMGITLWDCTDFYDRLRIKPRPAYGDVDDETIPFFPFVQAIKKNGRLPREHMIHGEREVPYDF
jgi:restriction system protein